MTDFWYFKLEKNENILYNVDNKANGEEQKVRIGIFGGSFDPIHVEHIRMAQEAIRTLALNTLFVMPASAPPHKKGKTLSSDVARLDMCRLAFKSVEKVQVSDYEISRGDTSYTYLTCRHFKALYPNAEIFWLVGTDMLRDFSTWKNPQDILDNVTLAVCARAERAGWLQEEKQKFYALFKKEFVIIDYEATAVSSTQIRVLAGAGMQITHLTDENVAAYIEREGLYKIPFAGDALSLEKPSRKEHTLRVAYLAAKRALGLKIPERKAVTAALFHDCAKNIDLSHPLLQGFAPNPEWGEIPLSVLHQFTGAYLAERVFGVTDEEVLDAIRFHTSGKADMTELGKLVFLADMLEEGRGFAGVEYLRALFWKDKTLIDECLLEALAQSVEFLKEKGADIYPLTLQAYEYYKRKGEEYGKQE